MVDENYEMRLKRKRCGHAFSFESCVRCDPEKRRLLQKKAI